MTARIIDGKIIAQSFAPASPKRSRGSSASMG